MIHSVVEKPIYRCPVCGSDISQYSERCRHCGAQFKPDEIRTKPTQSEEAVTFSSVIPIILVLIELIRWGSVADGSETVINTVLTVLSIGSFIIVAICCIYRRQQKIIMILSLIGALAGSIYLFPLLGVINVLVSYKYSEGFVK